MNVETAVFLNTPSFSIESDMRLSLVPGSDISELSRRVTRTATLDGSAAFVDGGHSAADRTMVMTLIGHDGDQADKLRLWVKTYAFLVVAIKDGVFLAAPERINVTNGQIVLRLLVSEELSNG